MAPPQRSCSISFLLSILLISAAGLLSVSGKIDCEELPIDLCAFAVSSNGARCILEKKISSTGAVEHECLTSIVFADQFPEWTETDECVKACGLERMSVGMSSDSLVEIQFIKPLCSDSCQDNCPNVIDLYTKLAAGEGASLSQLCQELQYSRRMMGEMPSLASKSANTHFWKAGWSPSASPVLGSRGFFFEPAPAPCPPPFKA